MKPDTQYRDLLKKILKDGVSVMPKQEEQALCLFGHQMKFDLNNGFPMITERDLLSDGKITKSIFHQSLGELFAFLHGSRYQTQLERFGCKWWKPWITKEKCEKRGLEEGDLGPGSYGPAWRYFPTLDGKYFDQIVHIVQQIKELPNLRTHFISPWIPQYIGRGKGKTQSVVVTPCHGWLHFLINIETGEISLHHFQRSADVPVGLVCNMIQYAALLMIVAQVTGYKPKELVYTISDAHIYVKQIPAVEKMLATEPMPFPTVKMNPEIDEIFEFRQADFEAFDYTPQNPRMVIWTPV